jgi:hypothetical protein
MMRRGMMWLTRVKNALMVIGLTVAALVAGIARQEQPQFETTATVTRATRGEDGNYTVWAQCQVSNRGEAADVTVIATLSLSLGLSP